MRKGSVAAAFAVLVAAAVAATAVATTAAPRAYVQLSACTNVSLGFLGPLTGPAARLGREQLSWLRFGVQKYNRANGTRFRVVTGDTKLEASVARTQARRLIANRKVLAVIGGSETQAVRASGTLLAAAKLASISGSATAVSLTQGRPFATFFRVVPHDGVQGRTVVDLVSGKLNAKHVVVIDSQDDDSTPLAGAIARGLGEKGVTVSRASVSADDTDFAPVVVGIDAKVSVVVFATQVASAANTLSNQLREQAKKAIVVATDGAYSPTEFKPRYGYVSVFAPDLHLDPKARTIVREYGRYVKEDTSGAYGPPTYMAGLVAMTAIRKACRNDAVSRAEVVDLVQSSNVPSILGGAVRFDRRGDLRGGGRFAIYKVTNGKYAPVG